ncbi:MULTISPECIES: DUF6455 family protein [Methylobacterium]|jgi:Family of unknown function (DUF6455)|uniref:Heavy-metal resistance n=1 Tax=Methylobacterium aquaticum TaxID=270351 RepID=A0A0C6FLL9_9HYPH|nr:MULTISPECIES: DUF6455 family protein [Methylobacterium]NGM38790.1 heavy-metal resistance [Methylobacterium sp. DB0501]BAQ49253.1 heavy-metal resistance [Methylobacterium aquaticum]
MSTPACKSDPFDAFGIAATMEGWRCMLKVARELRDVDAEMMDTLLDAHASGGMAQDRDAADKVRSLATLMCGLHLEPEALRRSRPEIVRELEAACLGCAERARCTRELRGGTAADTYPEFCPNAARLDGLREA